MATSSSSQKPKVGFIGLGGMGTAIAQHILKAGYPLTVYNRTPAKAAEFVRAGAVLAVSPADLARNCAVIFMILMDDRSVLECVSGSAMSSLSSSPSYSSPSSSSSSLPASFTSSTCLLAGLQPNTVVINLTTISAAATRELQFLIEGVILPPPSASSSSSSLSSSSSSSSSSSTTPCSSSSNCLFVSAPVLGRPNVAAAGKLRTLVAYNASPSSLSSSSSSNCPLSSSVPPTQSASFSSNTLTFETVVRPLLSLYAGGGIFVISTTRPEHAAVMKLACNFSLEATMAMFGQA